MKKNVLLIGFMFLSILLVACDSESEDLENLDNSESDIVFTVGEVDSSDGTGRARDFQRNCGMSGSSCANRNSTLTYTYVSPDSNPTITWSIDSGDISIISGQGTNTVTLYFGSSFIGGTISVNGVGPSNCYVQRDISLCGINNCTTYFLGILDEYIDGTQSGANFVYLQASGSFPTGTTYAWSIKRQDGSIQNYSAATNNPRQVTTTFSNRIVEATVTAEYQDCIRSVTKTFNCPIPNADQNGNLFPDCL